MKVNILDINGKPKKKIELPTIFSENFRPDLIKRTVLALQSQRRHPYGTDPTAGFKTSAHYHGKRRERHTMMNRDMARLPRLHTSSPHLMWRVRRTPEAVKGRKAHPPKTEKKWEQRVNKKENRIALRSAIAATANKDIVKKRGHRIEKIEQLPLVLVNDIQKIKKTKDFEKLLLTLGLEEEIGRCKDKKIRAGKGKMRGRKYKRKIGPLIVVGNDEGLVKGASNIPGVDVIRVDDVSVENLAPGTCAGRLTLWSESAVEKLRGF